MKTYKAEMTFGVGVSVFFELRGDSYDACDAAAEKLAKKLGLTYVGYLEELESSDD